MWALLLLFGLAYGAEKEFEMNYLEKHFIEDWMWKGIDDRTLEFVVKRVRPEALDLIKDEELKERAKKCQKVSKSVFKVR